MPIHGSREFCGVDVVKAESIRYELGSLSCLWMSLSLIMYLVTRQSLFIYFGDIAAILAVWPRSFTVKSTMLLICMTLVCSGSLMLRHSSVQIFSLKFYALAVTSIGLLVLSTIADQRKTQLWGASLAFLIIANS